jgi:hypothetical protein
LTNSVESERAQQIAAADALEAGANRPSGPFWKEQDMGRGILLWLLGVPIPIIIILALLWH